MKCECSLFVLTGSFFCCNSRGVIELKQRRVIDRGVIELKQRREEHISVQVVLICHIA
jgi:hypothetical protein